MLLEEGALLRDSGSRGPAGAGARSVPAQAAHPAMTSTRRLPRSGRSEEARNNLENRVTLPGRTNSRWSTLPAGAIW